MIYLISNYRYKSIKISLQIGLHILFNYKYPGLVGYRKAQFKSGPTLLSIIPPKRDQVISQFPATTTLNPFLYPLGIYQSVITPPSSNEEEDEMDVPEETRLRHKRDFIQFLENVTPSRAISVLYSYNCGFCFFCRSTWMKSRRWFRTSVTVS